MKKRGINIGPIRPIRPILRAKTLLEISVVTTTEAEEAVAELLGRVFGRAAAVYVNEETRVVTASVYCERAGEWNARRKNALAAGLRHLRDAGLNPGLAPVSARRVAREDWAESWKRHFKPIAVGRRLLIKPSWIQRRPVKGQAVVVLDPGLSFGTGNHPTTAFCLRQLVACRRPGTAQGFLDIGTGSGILAISAAKLGYSPVEAIDFDPEAVRAAGANARLNGVSGSIRLRRADIARLPKRSREQYALICANLISDLLVRERERIVNRLHPDGRLVLAGILQGEFSAVRRAYEEAGAKLVRSKADGEWESGVFSVARAGGPC